MMTPADFKELSGVRLDAGMKTLIVVTHDAGVSADLRAGGVETYAGWHLTREGATPASIAIEPATHGLSQLEGRWPLSELSDMNIAVVGCGSIGSAAAEALAGYGVGSLQLIDPDRLQWHNLVRHSLDRGSVGRSKAIALAESLTQRWQRKSYFAHDLDVVRDAGVFRALTSDADLVLCTADGIAPRRVVSHVARRAKIPAIVACVLDGGAIGEVLRLRPTPRFGCLLCVRAHMEEQGAIDAEADQELAYGTGTSHLPMTAVPSDLKFVGVLAAKAAVATLLESRFGDAAQRLPSEHAVIGLRPAGDLSAPFDVNHAADVVWRSIPAPRPECVTCNP
ncbi:ThiF family adenylyltransferase [Microbacterium sp. R1]|nr:ThiF family adenylyltransferase [Microbacterium sp. R1]